MEDKTLESAPMDNTVRNDNTGKQISKSEYSSALLAKLLAKMPMPSWGWLSYKYPAFFGFLNFAVLIPAILMIYCASFIYLLIYIPFPLNYITAIIVWAPLELMSWASGFQYITRKYLLQSYKCNPKAIEEYVELIKKH